MREDKTGATCHNVQIILLSTNRHQQYETLMCDFYGIRVLLLITQAPEKKYN